jgi:hypothetical protein
MEIEESDADLVSNCECLSSKVILFQLNLFKMLCEYTKYREKMCVNVANLIQSRLKIREATVVQTNTDNLHLQSIATQFLICPELATETELNMNDSSLISQLDGCLFVLEAICNKKVISEKLKLLEKTLYKQFFDSIDLLAQLYGFFGVVTNKAKTLKFKLEMLCISDLEKINSLNSEALVSYANTINNLMKSYLSAGMCEEFENLNREILISTDSQETKNSADSKNITPKTLGNSNGVNINKNSNLNANTEANSGKKKSIPNTTTDFSLEKTLVLLEKNKLISSKPETLISFYLTLTHYFILAHKVSD